MIGKVCLWNKNRHGGAEKPLSEVIVMKCMHAVLFIFFLTTSFCAQDQKNVSSVTRQVVVYDSLKTLKPRFYIPTAEVNHGDTLVFVAERVKTPVIFLIPRAGEIFERDSTLETYDEIVMDGVKFLIIVVKKQSNWQSEKLVVRGDPKQKKDKKYRYGAYLPKRNAWAEGDSSPVIIIKPGS